MGTAKHIAKLLKSRAQIVRGARANAAVTCLFQRLVDTPQRFADITCGKKTSMISLSYVHETGSAEASFHRFRGRTPWGLT